MKKILFVLVLAVSLAIMPAHSVSAAQGPVTARVLVDLNTGCSGFDSATGNFTFCLHLYIYPLTGQNVEVDGVQVATLPADTQAQIVTKITTAVVNTAAASANGYTVARTAVLIPSYVRGQ